MNSFLVKTFSELQCTASFLNININSSPISLVIPFQTAFLIEPILSQETPKLQRKVKRRPVRKPKKRNNAVVGQDPVNEGFQKTRNEGRGFHSAPRQPSDSDSESDSLVSSEAGYDSAPRISVSIIIIIIIINPSFLHSVQFCWHCITKLLPCLPARQSNTHSCHEIRDNLEGFDETASAVFVIVW